PIHIDRIEQLVDVRLPIRIEIFKASIVNLAVEIGDHAALAPCLLKTDPAIAIGVRDVQRPQPDLSPDHLYESAAKHVGSVASFAAVLRDGGAGASVAIRRVVTDG